MKSWNKPTTEQLEAAIARIQDATSRAYFFERLNNPLWVEPLYMHGFFRQPGEPVTNPETGEVRFSPSPELRYLSRMAAEIPREIAQILLSLPETENIMVYYEILSAVLKMPPEDAAPLAPKLLESVAHRSQHLDYKLTEVLDHFASGGESDVAILLAREILRLDPPEPIGERSYRLYTGPRSFLHDVNYELILTDIVPKLVEQRPFITLRLLLNLMDSIVKFDLMQQDSNARDNGLAISRDSIELDAPSWDDDLSQAIISATRDAARSIWSEQRESRILLIESLQSFRWKVGLRFAFDVLAYADPPPLLLFRDRLVDHSHFSDRDIYSEYRRLLRSGFSQLNPADRELILTWIDQEASQLAADQTLDDREYADRVAKHQKREWLSSISDYLDGQWARTFRDLCNDSELGPLREPSHWLVPREGMWTGPTSPKSSDEFMTMSIDEIVNYMREWKPSGKPMDHSTRGVARAFGQMVKQRARYVSASADRFIGLDHTYIYQLISGMREAVREDADVSWDALIELSEWVMLQESVISRNDSSRMDGIHWSECRKSIVQLLQSAFASKTCSPPFLLRQRVWRLIDAALRDPKPHPADEAAYGPPNMDPFTSALNFTRGAAMIAAVEYALWVQRHLLTSQDNGLSTTSLKYLPEVQMVLERHLQPDFEPSISIRSVYGRYFAHLYSLDSAWCEIVADKIFASKSQLTPLGMVAWQSYLVANRPSLLVFRLLKPHYRSSVRRLPMPDYAWSHRTPERALFEHVLLLYLNAHTDLDDNSLVSLLYQNSNPELCGYGNTWLGTGIHDGDVSDDMIARARSLWEWRVESVQASSDSQSTVELRSFGWWLRSDKFDVYWLASNLVVALRLAKQVDCEELVLNWLAQNAIEIPGLAIESVRLMCVESYKEYWVLDSWIDDIRTVLRIVLRSRQLEATQKAGLLVEDLVSRGLLSAGEFSVD